MADTRQQWKVKHTLSDIIFIALVATIANADEWTEIEMFAQKNEQFFKQYIALENGIPTHDTIRRVMAMINPDVLQSLVNEWHALVEQGAAKAVQKIINIDGKTIKGNQQPAHLGKVVVLIRRLHSGLISFL